MTQWTVAILIGALALIAAAAPVWSAQTTTVQGYILDPNWYAPHPKLTSPQVYGTGLYEYGIAGNITSSSNLGFYTNTESTADNHLWGIYGHFQKANQYDGTYTLSTWDVWWRPTFVFNQYLNGASTPEIIVRQHANMWSYGPDWEANYNEFGQTFAASGSSVVMVIVRSAVGGINLTASIHDGGPTGPQIGPSRSATSAVGPGDTRFVWNGGEVPTTPGHVYYLKIKAPAGNYSAVLCNNDPIPDYSDAMPEGYAYHEGVPWYQTSSTVDYGKGMDLGVTICSDDDGILTNMFLRSGGTDTGFANSVGQTFRARGTSLLSFVAWIPDGNNTYVATVYNSVGGTQIGTANKSRQMRWGDPEILWTWSPGELPLTPGQTYYIEVTKDPAGPWYTAYANPYNVYANGQAYKDRVAQTGVDLAGTIMEEESPGSATVPTVQFTSFPTVALADRGMNSLTIRWTTDVASDTTIEYCKWAGPYTNTYTNSTSVTSHVTTLTGLESNTMYHLRVRCAAPGYRTGVTRDFVACTINDSPNLLTNPSFELPGGSTSPVKPPPGWSCNGMDWGESNGTWFWGLPPYAGNWLLEGATNSSGCDANVWQTVTGLTPGKEYNFTVAVTSWMREGSNPDYWKYDVWYDKGRADFIKLGVDPYGNNNPTNPAVWWQPRMYSHLHYTVIGTHIVALSDKVTFCIALQGAGGCWHLYGIDDARVSTRNPLYTAYTLTNLKMNAADGLNAEVSNLIVTASTAEAGAYYAETADRSTGIRIVSSDLYVFAGKKVAVRGTLYTDPQTKERMLKDAFFISQVSDTQPKPLQMHCRNVGGARYGPSLEVPGSTGPHNTGLAVEIGGRVTAKDTNSKWIFVNDGSMAGDGIKVDTSHISAANVPNVNSTVVIAGISSRYYSSGIKAVVIVRRASDVKYKNP